MSSGAVEDKMREAIKRDKIDRMIVNHCCVFGRLLLGVMLLHYLLLSALYNTLNMNFIKVYKAVNENEQSTKHREII